jgi:hypothetical protein
MIRQMAALGVVPSSFAVGLHIWEWCLHCLHSCKRRKVSTASMGWEGILEGALTLEVLQPVRSGTRMPVALGPSSSTPYAGHPTPTVSFATYRNVWRNSRLLVRRCLLVPRPVTVAINK